MAQREGWCCCAKLTSMSMASSIPASLSNSTLAQVRWTADQKTVRSAFVTSESQRCMIQPCLPSPFSLYIRLT